MHYKYLIPAFLLILLTGCGLDVNKPSEDLLNGADARQAISLQHSGQYQKAAESWQQAAAKAKTDIDRAILSLYAAENWNMAADYNAALRVLTPIKTDIFEDSDKIRYHLIAAQAHLRSGHTQKALNSLKTIDKLAMNRQQHIKQLQLYAEAWPLQGNTVAAIHSLNQLSQLQSNRQQRLFSQQAIMDLMADKEVADLNNLKPNDDPVTQGWLDLGIAWKEGAADPDHAKDRLLLWRAHYPKHPAEQQLLNNLIERIDALLRRPKKIAVLLPQSGPYAAAAKAIREGLIAAYYDDPEGSDIPLVFYDNSNQADTRSHYQQAVQDGADLLIGPLNKQAVEQLEQSHELSMPVLALNQVTLSAPPADGFYQYALSPESEARQLAEKAWLDGKRTAIALVPDDSWGKRMASAFADHWQSLGGILLNVQPYPANSYDFSDQITQSLNIAASQQRKNQLQSAIRRNVEFEPRRRQDVDFIFLAARGNSARQILPQLKFYHAADVPVYTTSHFWSGIANSKKDIDLDGATFADIPWILGDDNSTALSLQQFSASVKALDLRYLRLYAMGMDAWHLAANLGRLHLASEESLDGKTGILSIDKSGIVHRRLVWARFQNGGQVELLGFAPRHSTEHEIEQSEPAPIN